MKRVLNINETNYLLEQSSYLKDVMQPIVNLDPGLCVHLERI